MLNIETPTLEEACACALIEGLMQNVVQESRATPKALFAAILLGSGADINVRHASDIADKACELLDEMKRIGNKADELLAAEKGTPS